jgi:hypothetical protein
MNKELIQWINGDMSFLFSSDENKKVKKQIEKKWGLGIIKQMKPKAKPSDKWTGPLGQCIIETLLPYGRKPKIYKGHPIPDWETDDFVFEIKSQSYNGGDAGTAYEKVGILKHRNVSTVYNKPLIIICFGFLEQILKNKSFKKDDRLHSYIELGRSWDIKIVWGSDFIKDLKC